MEKFKGYSSDIIENGGKFLITGGDLNKNIDLFSVVDENRIYLYTVCWVGSDMFGDGYVAQPSIYIDPNNIYGTTPEDNLSLSFDGSVNYIKGSDNLYFPDNGNPYNMKVGAHYFFNNSHPMKPEAGYALDANNKSFTLHNISVYSKTFVRGGMMDFRAMYNGDPEDETSPKRVDILTTYDRDAEL